MPACHIEYVPRSFDCARELLTMLDICWCFNMSDCRLRSNLMETTKRATHLMKIVLIESHRFKVNLTKEPALMTLLSSVLLFHPLDCTVKLGLSRNAVHSLSSEDPFALWKCGRVRARPTSRMHYY